MRYPAHFEKDPDGGFVVTFRDIPEAITQGETEQEAMDMAEDALRSAMEFYFEDKRKIPQPSKALPDEVLVMLPPSVWAKVLLLNEMIDQKIKPAELARKLGTIPQNVNRLTDLEHPTKIDAINEALMALGSSLELTTKQSAIVADAIAQGVKAAKVTLKQFGKIAVAKPGTRRRLGAVKKAAA